MHLHAVPADDLIEHEVDHDGGCACGPSVQLHTTEAGDAWIYTHHSLDRRESQEAR